MMMYIPSIGDKIVLEEDWNPMILDEYRTREFLVIMGIDPRGANGHTYAVVIPRNTVLTVDRIYIKKGSSAYDSITFTINQAYNPHIPRGKKRFWVKLAQANKIQFHPYVEAKP